jgi:uncharacterized protein (DUF1697 family)
VAKAVALLRAVNVGGTGKIAMADLKAFAVDIGLGEPETLLQSGNLLFDAGGKSPATLEKLLEKEAASRLDLKTDFMVRTGKDLAAVRKHNPFTKQARSDPGFLHVHFLKSRATAADVKTLVAAIKGPEQVDGSGAEIFIFYPDGAGHSKLTSAVIARHLGTSGTSRNWNTVTKLAALTAD